MDPVTIVGLLASVVQLIDATTKAYQYLNDVKDAPRERSTLGREALSLLVLLQDLRDRVENTKDDQDPWFAGVQSLGAPGGPLDQFKACMDPLATKLAPSSKGLAKLRALKWTLDKKAVADIFSKIERVKSIVSLALQKDLFNLSIAIKKDTAELGSRIDSMAKDSQHYYHVTQSDRKIQELKKAKEQIFQWLNAPDPASNHKKASQERQPHTGTWFLESQQYEAWKRGSIRSIWLYGITGCGKTVLSSSIINDIRSHCEDKTGSACAYFYFDFRDERKQQPENLIRSILHQLLAARPDVPVELNNLFIRCHEGSQLPTCDDMILVLRSVITRFTQVYIVVDALDESQDREILLAMIEELDSWQPIGLSFLLTSRQEKDIEAMLIPIIGHESSVQGVSVDHDIRTHLQERMEYDTKLKRWPLDVRKEIEETLMKNAHGMFRWVICQLDELKKCIKLTSLRKALSSLPKTLNSTYARILSSIDEEYQEDALRILQWLCFSNRPIYIKEMVEALAIDLSHQCLDPERTLVDSDDILIICPSLVTITGDRDAFIVEPQTFPDGTSIPGIKLTEPSNEPILSLAHFSVKEFLVSERVKVSGLSSYYLSPVASHLSIAKTCLVYLLHCCSNESQVVAQNLFPLIEYAAKEWPAHYGDIDEQESTEEVDDLALRMMADSTRHFKTWRDFCYTTNFAVTSLETPLGCMVWFQVFGVVRLMLKKGADLNAELEGGRIPLTIAARSESSNSLRMIKLLLVNGADINRCSDTDGTILQIAILDRNQTLFDYVLLEENADPNIDHPVRGTALSVAIRVCKEDTDIGSKFVDTLLDHGADVNANAGAMRSPLNTAIKWCLEPMVRRLLEKGADLNAESDDSIVALTYAAMLGFDDIVRTLLPYGADINFTATSPQDKEHWALGAAVEEGNVATVRLLLEKGANVKGHVFAWEHCRRLALAKGGINTLRLLASKGADLKLRSENTGLSEWKTKKIQNIMVLQGDSEYGHEIEDGILSPDRVSDSEEEGDTTTELEMQSTKDPALKVIRETTLDGLT